MSRRRDLDALDIALGEVPADAQAGLADRLRDDPRLRAEVERLAPVVARLERQPADTWDAPDPPPLVVGAPLPGAASPRRGLRSRWRDVVILRPAAAVAASVAFVAAGVVGGVVLTGDDRSEPGGAPPSRVLTLGPVPVGEGGTGERAAGMATLVDRGRGRVTVEVRGVVADSDGRFHQLWLLPAEGAGAPVSVGTFRVGDAGRETVTFDLPDDPERYRFLDVSAEPPDGNPDHSGTSVLRAPV
jgi:anti-sigma-K factor RskA